MADRPAAIRATEPFFLFDYFRVPYRLGEPSGVVGSEDSVGSSPLYTCGALHVRRPDGSDAVVRWPSRGTEVDGMLAPGPLRLGDVRLWGRVIPDRVARGWLDEAKGEWTPSDTLHDGSGRPVASIWTDEHDNVLLPFDPQELIEAFWREDHFAEESGGELLLRAYYRVRPVMPRRLQIAVRRLYSRVQARRAFPGWPAETALHDLYSRLFARIVQSAGTRIPYLAPWPDGHSWAFVLTHDVETAAGYRDIAPLCDLERSLGYRSSWNLVAQGYDVDDEMVERLVADGFEIGVHGFRHDGRDFESIQSLRSRVPEIRRSAERWGAQGFRSPSTLRVWDWMPELGFDYDSSYSDTAPFEPQPGGCCSLLPFFNHGLVELPVTMPQDHTLFVLLGERDERLWLEKAELVRGMGGMALMLTHPDYATPTRLDAYRRLLAEYREDQTAWRALPCEVSAWWRARAASRLEPQGAGWRAVGPAAERARVAFA